MKIGGHGQGNSEGEVTNIADGHGRGHSHGFGSHSTMEPTNIIAAEQETRKSIESECHAR